MSSYNYFVIVGRDDNPLYETEYSSVSKKDDNSQLHQFVLHAALDVVDDLEWNTTSMYIKAVDKFGEYFVSTYVTAGRIRLMLLHDHRNDDGIKAFFQEIYEIYVKHTMNPFYIFNSKICSTAFDDRVALLARKYL